MDTTDRPPPRWSTGWVVSPRCRGRHRPPSTTTSTAIGTLGRNTDPHQKRPSSSPPSRGPNAEQPPPMPDHNAIARVRAPPRNSPVISDRVIGYSSPAATPPLTRATIRTVALGAHAASSDAGIDKAPPSIMAGLRPHRPASAPRYSTDEANPRVNPTATRFSSAWLVSSAAPIDGNATLAIARLMLATTAPRISTVRIAPARGGLSPAEGRSPWGGPGTLAIPAELIVYLLASRSRTHLGRRAPAAPHPLGMKAAALLASRPKVDSTWPEVPPGGCREREAGVRCTRGYADARRPAGAGTRRGGAGAADAG